MDKVAQISIPSLPSLHGRGPDTDRLVTTIQDKHQRCALITGVSGIGKTAVLDWLAGTDKLKTQLRLKFSITSEATSTAELVQKLSADLAKSDAVDLGTATRFWDYLASEPLKNGRKLGQALLGDFIKAKLGSGEQTAKAIGEIVARADERASTDSRAETLSQAAADDFKFAFKSLLRAVSEDGRSGLIIIDGLEYASTDMVATVKSICAELPNDWGLAIACNTELASGLKVASDVGEFMAYRNGLLMDLRPLTSNDVLDWMQFYNPSRRAGSEIDDAISVTQGRPYYIERWLRGEDLSDLTLALGKKVSLAYRRRYVSLSKPAQVLLAKLCLAPDLPNLQEDLIEALSRDVAAPTSIGDILELENAGFIKKGVAGEILVHSETRAQIKNIIGPPALATIADELVRSLDKIDGPKSIKEEYNLIVLQEAAGNTKDLSRQAEAAGSRLLSTSPEGAIRLYEIAARHASDDFSRIRLQLNECKALIGMGNYDEGLAQTNKIEAGEVSDELRLDINLLRLKALARLNKYVEAKLLLGSIAKVFAAGKPALRIEFMRIQNTIERDLGDYKSALSTARRIKKLAEEVGQSDTGMSRVYRTLSRTQALAGQRKAAIKSGKLALELAESAGSLRDLGNAKLALGEAYRHSHQLDKARASYESASQLALSIGNIDSLLWSMLGLADVEFLEKNFEECKSTLQKMEAILGEKKESRHPLEAFHWSFSVSSLEFALKKVGADQLIRAAEAYDRYTIVWPRQYAEGLIKGGGSDPKRF